jgi:hypothetical protein
MKTILCFLAAFGLALAVSGARGALVIGHLIEAGRSLCASTLTLCQPLEKALVKGSAMNSWSAGAVYMLGDGNLSNNLLQP